MTGGDVGQVQRRVRRTGAFDVHLAIFVVVNGGIALVSWVVSPSVWWMVFLASGWGAVLTVHALSAFRGSFLRSASAGARTRDILVRV